MLKNIFVLYPKDRFSSNTYLLVGKKNIIIDPGNHSREYLKSFLEKYAFNFDDIESIILTHAHADHFLAGAYFKKALFYVHENDAYYLKLKDKFYTAMSYFDKEFFPKNIYTIDDSFVFDIGSFILKAVHTPGHSFGSIVLYEASKKILFSGDTLFYKSCGRFDLLSSNKDMLQKSLEKIKKLDFEYLCAGHNEVYNASINEQKENIDNVLKKVFY